MKLPSISNSIHIHTFKYPLEKVKEKFLCYKTDNASHPNDIMMKNWIRIVPKTFTNNIQPKFLSRFGQMVHSIFICYTYVPASRFRIGFDMCFWYNISCVWKWINDSTFLLEVIWEFIVLFYVLQWIFWGLAIWFRCRQFFYWYGRNKHLPIIWKYIYLHFVRAHTDRKKNLLYLCEIYILKELY